MLYAFLYVCAQFRLILVMLSASLISLLHVCLKFCLLVLIHLLHAGICVRMTLFLMIAFLLDGQLYLKAHLFYFFAINYLCYCTCLRRLFRKKSSCCSAKRLLRVPTDIRTVNLPFVRWTLYRLSYTVKKGLAVFFSPAGISLTKLSLAGNNLPNPSPWKIWSWKIQESRNFVYSERRFKELILHCK